ncbi:cytosine permease [Lactiplantibacillus daowaiensis]|uniref:Cytosine permease n=1 Tax=Lactiplantibacillus daowaiensis TaxID=2559918 RepID=A0ABW1S1W9_9LACO|nr:cytosine permease [Lactiplantibacillus daowaiensis]
MKQEPKYQIEVIPTKHRHMSNWDMFATWIGANANNGTWYVGGVLAACGLLTALKVIIASSTLSYLCLSLVGFMGYRTGAATMSLIRGSFGIRGSYVPSFVNLTQYIGWTAVNTFIAATSVSYLLHDIVGWPVYGKPGGAKGLILGIVVMSILHLLSVSVGQKSVQMIERLGIILVILFVLWETVVVFKTVSFSELLSWHAPAKLHMTAGAGMDTLAAFNLSWVTAGADFTRFTKKRSGATGMPFLGAFTGLFWFAFIGLAATISIAITSGTYDPNNSDPSTIASRLGLGVLALLVIVLTSMTANAVNLLAAGSALSNIFPKIRLRPALWAVTIIATLVTLIPLVMGSFLTAFTAFLDYIGMVLGPMISVMLVDYYWRHHQHYDVDELANSNGQYWYTHGVNWIALLCWVLGVGIFLMLKYVTLIANVFGATFIDMILIALIYMGLMRIFYPLKTKAA